jgi:N-formylglutamate amidohydrolase
MYDEPWNVERGEGPIVAMAIHHGHLLRDEVQGHMALDEASRLREEDPFTGGWTVLAPNRVVVTRSRFEMDLNRPRNKSIYRSPEDAWGLSVWKESLPDAVVQRSLAQYDDFYLMLEKWFESLEQRFGRFVVYDLHSYNHRRDGAYAAVAPPEENPEVNLGTGTMKDRSRWASVIERFMVDLEQFDFPRGKLDVRENVRFRGGELARWTHERFPTSACVLSIEVKKIFMDEWTGEPVAVLVDSMKEALRATLPGVLEELAR